MKLELRCHDIMFGNTDTRQFSLAPEVGVRFAGTTGVPGLLSVRYNNNFETSELDAQSYLTLNVGVYVWAVITCFIVTGFKYVRSSAGQVALLQPLA